jgi:hypothetical protein
VLHTPGAGDWRKHAELLAASRPVRGVAALLACRLPQPTRCGFGCPRYRYGASSPHSTTRASCWASYLFGTAVGVAISPILIPRISRTRGSRATPWIAATGCCVAAFEVMGLALAHASAVILPLYGSFISIATAAVTSALIGLLRNRPAFRCSVHQWLDAECGRSMRSTAPVIAAIVLLTWPKDTSVSCYARDIPGSDLGLIRPQPVPALTDCSRQPLPVQRIHRVIPPSTWMHCPVI